ncbi:DUF4138 domain-containing protein [Bacteroides pyogenes]|uniref:DUF4138 domain-containing protein n=1 Tax=Bacteroides pyogenes TaxID=310300 RepID=A0A5D3E9W9_9BACE|nr:DUF4138 domain-containing protein [Bacteroides pyogenes]TYK32834.1 DUF4138 domain-containing protein [Bacteroides pyogenes]
MKKTVTIITFFLSFFHLGAQETKSFENIVSPCIYMEFDKITHVVFPSAVISHSVGNPEYITARTADKACNIVALTVMEEDFPGETNFSAICEDGQVFSYRIKYHITGKEHCQDVIYAGNAVMNSECHIVIGNSHNVTEVFFPEKIRYCRQGNEKLINVEYGSNFVRIRPTEKKFTPSNLFVVDEQGSMYEICIVSGNAESYTYNISSKRPYVTYVPANSIEMKKFTDKIYCKKRNIYSMGIIKNKMEFSLGNLYIHGDYLFFAFDIYNKSYIPYDVDFVKCFIRDLKTSKKEVQQSIEYRPVYQRDFERRINGRSHNRFVLVFDKFTIPDNKSFDIEVFEKNGGRHIKLSILNQYILSAQILKEKKK